MVFRSLGKVFAPLLIIGHREGTQDLFGGAGAELEGRQKTVSQQPGAPLRDLETPSLRKYRGPRFNPKSLSKIGAGSA